MQARGRERERERERGREGERERGTRTDGRVSHHEHLEGGRRSWRHGHGHEPDDERERSKGEEKKKERERTREKLKKRGCSSGPDLVRPLDDLLTRRAEIGRGHDRSAAEKRSIESEMIRGRRENENS